MHAFVTRHLTDTVMVKKGKAANEALFEEDYVLRSLGRIGYDPDVALTELVANTWDAGAAKVNVIIPSETGDILSVEDDGHGMTEEQFRKRWMTLGYNRQKNQGDNVQFPADRADSVRKAFGRNGIGRHGRHGEGAEQQCGESQAHRDLRLSGADLMRGRCRAQPARANACDITTATGIWIRSASGVIRLSYSAYLRFGSGGTGGA